MGVAKMSCVPCWRITVRVEGGLHRTPVSQKRRTAIPLAAGPLFTIVSPSGFGFQNCRSGLAAKRWNAETGGGQSRPGFTAVKQAILSCVPGSNDVWFDADLDQIVLSIQDLPCPLNTLSAGQKMMLALVADIAIKAVTQNAFLLSPDEIGTGPIPAVLAQTPGIVLIDELDVHLHPRWQRRVASDLKAIFPSIQFVCTSHSPQVIGELQPDEIRLLDGEYIGNPAYSFGIDSSRILEELMSTNRRDPSVDTDLATLAETIDREDFTEAKRLLEKLVATFGSDDPEVTRASALINFLELPV